MPTPDQAKQATVRLLERFRAPEHRAPIDRRRVHHVELWIECRPAPLHAPLDAGACANRVQGQRCGGVLAAGDRHLEQVLLRVAVEPVQEAVLADGDDQVPPLAVHLRRVQGAGLRQVPVVFVMRHDLVMPLERSGPGIEDDH